MYDDFEEKVWEGGLRGDYQLDEPTFEAVRESEHAAEIIYALASDPKEAARVASMTPTQQVRYVVSKEAELSDKPARVTKAPPPPGQSVRGSSGRYSVAADTDDLDAFEKEFFQKR